jgi:hypothetical protein
MDERRNNEQSQRQHYRDGQAKIGDRVAHVYQFLSLMFLCVDSLPFSSDNLSTVAEAVAPLIHTTA